MLGTLTGRPAVGSPSSLSLLLKTLRLRPVISYARFASDFGFGVNLSGLQYERADPALAQLDGAPIRPLDWKWDYLAAKGVRLVRLPFLWEHTQPQLYGPLGMVMGGYSTNVGDPDRNSLQMIKSQVAKAAARGIKVVLECKNYGARAIPDANGAMAARTGYGKDGKYAIGSAEVPHSAFANFWARMAAEFRGDPTVIGFDIMNEPTKLIAGESWTTIPQGGPVWTEAARQAILAIRAAGAPQWVIVEGYSFATTGFWVRSNPDLHTLKGVDPLDRLIFSPHLYFDSNHAGTYLNAEATAPADFDADMARMLSNVAAFQGWLTDKGISRVFVGETGAPNTPAWQEIQRRFLSICRDRAWPVTLWGMWPNGEGNANVNDLTPIGGTQGAGGTDTIALRTLKAFIDAADTSEDTALFPPVAARANPQFTAVNIQGMENGDRGIDHTNDVAGTQYAIPSQADMNYLSARGVTVARLPFMFERMVPVLGGPLKASYLADVVTVLDRAAAATPTPVKILLDSHNYAERHTSSGILRLGTPDYTIAHHVDMWKRIAAAVKGHAGLFGYDVMNEPQGIASSVVADMYQACVNALATEDPNHWVFVEGNHYAGSHDWTGQNPSYPLADPADRIIYSSHMYADPGHGGNTTTYPTWASCVAGGSTDQTGVQNLDNFLDWLEATGKRGNIGEFGFYADGLQAAFNTITEARTRGASLFVWHYGPAFGANGFATYPYDGTEQPHWSVLGRFTGYVASTYTLSGLHGSAPGQQSEPFQVRYPGSPTQAITVTPSDGGKGGSFTPASIVLAAGTFAPSASFTYANPAAVTGITISVANDRGLTNPAGLAFSTDPDNPVNLEPAPNMAWGADNGSIQVGFSGSYARLSDNGANGEHRFTSSTKDIAPNVSTETSVVFKDESRRYVQLMLICPDDPYQRAWVDIDLQDGTLGAPGNTAGVSGVIATVAAEGDGKRVRLQANLGAAKRARTIVFLASAPGTIIYAGGGVALLAGNARFHQPGTLPEAPDGQTFLLDSDGAYLMDDDGAYLTEISA